MAIYKGTALVSQIIGKLGDNIFQRWKNKKVVKSAEVSVENPNSDMQQMIRGALGFTSNRWANTLTAEQKTTWESYASKSPGYKKKPAGIRQLMDGNDGTFFGLNAAIKVNTQLIMAGLNPVDVAPLADAVPGLPLLHSASFNGTNLIVQWDTFNFPANSKVRIWIDSEQELFHKQILMYADAVDEIKAQSFVRGNNGDPVEFIDLLGSSVYLSIDCISPAGAISRAGNTVKFLIGGDDMFVYLPVRQLVLNLVAAAAPIGDTDLDLSAFVPAGASSVILFARHDTAPGWPMGAIAQIDLYNTVAQGVCLSLDNHGGDNEEIMFDTAIIPCSAVGHIRYAYANNGAGGITTNVQVYLLGYVT